MAAVEDTEITLGTPKLLVLFFGLVGVCALFFALGYSLGRKSEAPVTTASAAPAPQTSTNTSKSSGAATATPAQPMGFYKAVEQKDPNTELPPPANTKTDTSGTAATNSTTTNTPTSTTAASSNDPTALPGGGYFVQVAAVSKQEDAEALVDALKKKDYPAFVAPQTTDKLFRVQMGPFADFKEADGMRTRLVGDGYNPIVKK
jgi:DedD protein